MSRATTAVDKVMGRLCQGNWVKKPKGGAAWDAAQRRGGGGQRQPSVSRMSRAGGRHGKAVFKLIGKGGTSNRSGLKGQMNYIFNTDKVARIIDPSGRVDTYGVVENADINRMTLDWSCDWWNGTRNGNTSHMILSYPNGTSIDDVETITRAVCEEMFESGHARFKYVAAIHDDTEDHPHAHVIVNRRGSDSKLFNMRSGTEYSYEGFRESMAVHAGRIGIQLDPTFRFERGVRERQPSLTEQRIAHEEERAPRQRRYNDLEIEALDDKISHAKIVYHAMSVIAANANCERLERAYFSMAEIVEVNGMGGDFIMPELSADELERFDQYVTVLNDAFERTERVLQTKDAAARVPVEMNLTKNMRALTELNPNAEYAKALHQRADASSIYMHKLGDNAQDLHSPKVQEMLKVIEQDYGLQADAITARLEAQADNRYLEEMWIKDDIHRIAAVSGEDLDDPKGREVVMDLANDAHQVLREELVEAGILKVVPHLDVDYQWVPPKTATYAYMPERLESEIGDTIQHYKEGGAPDAWIAENKATIQNAVTERHKSEHDDYLAAHKEANAHIYAIMDRDGAGGFTIGDEKAAQELVDNLKARNLPDMERETICQAMGSDLMSRYPDMPHHTADKLGQFQYIIYDMMERAPILEKEHELTPAAEREGPFAKFYERKDAEEILINSREEMDEIIRLLRENTTSEQFRRFSNGHLDGIEHITRDPVFAAQLAGTVEAWQNTNTISRTREAENRFTEHSEALARAFGRDRGNEHSLER
ncbi:relaxase/mobilization nuclease domain-containing protein [Profundibacter sp.]